MPVGTAFHERTFQLCESLNYREWSGYYAVSSYEMHHEHEYNAIRNSAALIDISPLFKYRLTGRDATRLVNRVITRDINKVAVDQDRKHTSELQSPDHLVCRLLLEKKHQANSRH